MTGPCAAGSRSSSGRWLVSSLARSAGGRLSTAPTRCGQSPGCERGSMGTSTVIRAVSAVALGFAVVLGLVLAALAGAVRDGFAVLGHQTAPQVTATEDLYFALADMDAQLTNVLLAGDDPGL